MLGERSDKLKGEAGLVVRDALRAARHAVSLGRRRYRSVRERHAASGPTAGVLEGVDRLADGALDTAARVAHAALDLVSRRERVRLPAPADVFLRPSPSFRSDPKIIFAHAAYDSLRRSLRLLGAPNALVMETRIEAAFLAAVKEAQERDPAPLAFCARLVWELLRLQAIPHLALAESAGRDAARSETLVARDAIFALGLAVAAASCQGLGEEDAEAVLASATGLALALDDELSAAADPQDFERLLAAYAPHV